MKSVGEILRQARLDQGLEIADIATRLKINEKYLSAIEGNELGNLPGLFFYRSFVQQYGHLLGLDSSEVSSELDRVVGSRPEPPLPGQDGLPVAARRPAYGGGGQKRSLAGAIGLLAVAVLVCTGVFALWSNWSEVRLVSASMVDRMVEKPVLPTLPPAPTPAAPPLHAAAASQAVVSAESEVKPGTGHLLLRLTATEPT
jgi:hypothetical protein